MRGWFGDKKEVVMPRFTSRAEAFAFMLQYQLERTGDPMEAAKRANDFADIFATNLGIPSTSEPPPQGIDKHLQTIDKVVCYCEEHPRVVEFAAGALTFLVGAVFGKKTEQAGQPQEPITPVDAESLS